MNSRNKFPDGLSRADHTCDWILFRKVSLLKLFLSFFVFLLILVRDDILEAIKAYVFSSKWLLYVEIRNHVPEKTLESCKLPTGGRRTS
jgi:hypothetical protein